MIATDREYTTIKSLIAYDEIVNLPDSAIIPKTVTSGLQGIVTGIMCRQKHILCHRKFGVKKYYSVSDNPEKLKIEMLQFCNDLKRALISIAENFDKLTRKFGIREACPLYDFKKAKRYLNKFKYEDSPGYPVYFERRAPEFRMFLAEESDRIVGYNCSFRCSVVFLKSKDDLPFLKLSENDVTV